METHALISYLPPSATIDSIPKMEEMLPALWCFWLCHVFKTLATLLEVETESQHQPLPP